MNKGIIVVTTLCALTTSAFALTPKEVYKKSGPGVVLIMGSDDGKVGNSGTGSIISKDGFIITNAHVVISQATQSPYKILQVYLKPDRLTGRNREDLAAKYKLSCSRWSTAEELDLALCKIIDAPANLTTIAFTNPDDVEIGDSVVAIGHPEQGGLWTLTTGTVSSVIANFNRIKGKDVFQTEASINRGNSGGPLLDEQGNMIGINTLISRTATDGTAITDINFSLKSSVAMKWLNSIGVELAYATHSVPLAPIAVASNDSEPLSTSGATQNAISASKVEVQGEAPKAEAAKVEEPVAKVVETPAQPSAIPDSLDTVAPVANKEQAKETPVASKAQTVEEPAAKVDVKVVVTVEVESTKEQAAVAKEVVAAPPVKNVEASENVKGKKLDIAKAKPTYHTEKRPYNADDLRREQMQELEDMMGEFHHKTVIRKDMPKTQQKKSKKRR